MSETMIRWLVGLGVALVLGAFLTEWFVSALRSSLWTMMVIRYSSLRLSKVSLKPDGRLRCHLARSSEY